MDYSWVGVVGNISPLESAKPREHQETLWSIEQYASFVKKKFKNII